LARTHEYRSGKKFTRSSEHKIVCCVSSYYEQPTSMRSRQGSLSEQSRKRLQGGKLIKGLDDGEIAFILDVDHSSVWRWRQKLRENNDDLSCLARKKGSGRPPSLSDDEKQRLKEIILGGAVEAGYPSERWTSRNVRHILPTPGLSPQKLVVRSHEYSDEEVLRWSRNAWKRIKKSEKTRRTPDFRGRKATCRRIAICFALDDPRHVVPLP